MTALKEKIEAALHDADIWPDEVLPSRVLDVMERLVRSECEACATLAYKKAAEVLSEEQAFEIGSIIRSRHGLV
jgi:hypothetical protein